MHPSLSRPWLVLTVLASLSACAAPAREQRARPPDSSQGAKAAAAPDAKTFQKDMVSAHNRARASAKPAPKPALPALTWSEEAAKKAESYVGQCKFEHNPDRGEFGENLAAGTPGAMTTVDVVKGWADEAADYDYASNTCRKGKMCGHYTQVVWRNTKAVGCATRTCTKNSPFGAKFPTWQLWVCNYAPPGNYIGQKPY
jgi:uncharacterized protein YkwD